MTVLEVCSAGGHFHPDALPPRRPGAGRSLSPVPGRDHAPEVEGVEGSRYLVPVSCGGRAPGHDRQRRNHASARRTILDLLLARCPDAPMSCRSMAAEYGVTSYLVQEERYGYGLYPLRAVCSRLCGERAATPSAPPAAASSRDDRRSRSSSRRRIASAVRAVRTSARPARSSTKTLATCGRSGGTNSRWPSASRAANPVMPEVQLEYEAKKSGLDPGLLPDLSRLRPAADG